jgi:hypothetical protein
MTPKMLRELVDVVVRYNMGYVYRVRYMKDGKGETDIPLDADYVDVEIRFHAGGGKHGQAFFAYVRSECEKGWQETV